MVVRERPYKVIGTRPVRPDGVDKVTGRAMYGADLRLPRMLYARVKRSPYAHALIKRIDVSKARALPGVLGVITFADFPSPAGKQATTLRGVIPLAWLVDSLLADQKVYYVGHPVAAVAATDSHIAEDALDLIEVEYEPLTPVLDLQEAMLDRVILHDDLHTEELLRAEYGSPGERSTKPSNVAKHVEVSMGDVAQGFAEADVTVDGEFGTTMAHQGYIEPHTGAAIWTADDHLTVWASTQGAFAVREGLAQVLQIPISRVTVIPTEIGGGFGGKTKLYLEPLAALLAKVTGRPVKMWMTRQEVLEASGPTSGTHMRVKIGAKHDGTIVAAEAHFAFEAGAYPGSPFVSAVRTAFGAYAIPNQFVEGWDVVLNKPQVAAYRAPGAPAASFAVESLLDELATRLELDPMELRLKNASVEGTRRADGARFGVIGNVHVMQAIRDSDHYRSELSGPHRGRGVAMGFWFNGGNESSAYANVNADGTVSLVLGSVDIGGQRASLAMQLAETLGITAAQVRPQVVDTDSVGFTATTGGSRTTFASGWAVYEAAHDIRRQLEERTAQIWEVPREQVAYGDDGVLRGPDGKQLTFREIAAQLGPTGGMVQGRADVKPTMVGPAFAGHIVDVEVDIDTGKVQVLRYTAVQDVGTAVHPDYAEGQIQGGVVQGIGMTLTEDYWFDERGVMRNSSLLDYRMPTTLDVPMIDTILVEVPNPGHPYGVRGVGEVPIVPPLAAIANAIRDAIGVRMHKLPATPGAILLELGKLEQ